MTQPSEGQAATGVPTCYRHPDRETWIRCQRCDKPICPDCMRDAAVGFQCPDCVKQANKGSRQNRAMYGGERSADPRLTSYVLIGINAVVWLAITGDGRRRLAAGRPAGARPDRAVRPRGGRVSTTPASRTAASATAHSGDGLARPASPTAPGGSSLTSVPSPTWRSGTWR